ncbi:S8 family serine peptidase [Kribbella sp. NPDC026611]|uniref:S8 family peptidase n=1 Tax=Kribbella sp. NPDC026611 TaxID=3154911 RepID=UPI00340C2834
MAATIAAAVIATTAYPAAADLLAHTQPTVDTHRPAAGARAGAAITELTFTLITGDKVIVHQGPGGVTSTEVRPGAGRAGMMFHKSTLGDKEEVLPFDAVPLVAAGVLDARLFDVKLLATLHLDDASAPNLPLLIRYNARHRAAALPPGMTVSRRLALVDAVAVDQARDRTAALWKTWTSRTGIVEHVWLDGGLMPTLDRSVPQIGAPAAWRAGLTGKGVKVAVLDSGYDATHPDLKGRVVASKSFVEGGDATTDSVGHGTHVAATIAGSGAASGGRYRGVAPDAELLVGQVCSVFCRDSDVIAGLQWAADQGARIVNLSFGGAPSDGTDPVAQAVNTLTASKGTLFVAAAGNRGRSGTVGSPAAADAALAVASVTKSDTLSATSSRGPRIGDLAVKPDIAAPGDRIVSARAAGTLGQSAVNASYAELSGTSMAAPHVSGAAALVAQLHPTWKAAELKSALMNSALGLDGLDVYAQGTGRVDVARAVRQQVIATPAALNLGLQTSPHADDKPVSGTVTFHNAGPHLVRLRLALPNRMFSLSRRSVDVPAHGTATVDVTADTSRPGPDGAYGGTLVAIGNGLSIRTTVAVGKEAAADEHRLVLLDRAGRPVTNDDNRLGLATFVNLDTLESYRTEPGDTVRLPRGRYAVDAFIGTVNPSGQGYAEGVYLGKPDLVLDGPGDLVLDGREAVKVALRAPVAGADAASAGVGYTRPLGTGTFVGGIAVINPLTRGFSPNLYVVPTAGGSAQDFTGFAQAVWAKMPPNQPPDNDYYLDSPYLSTTWSPGLAGSRSTPCWPLHRRTSPAWTRRTPGAPANARTTTASRRCQESTVPAGCAASFSSHRPCR